MDEAKAIRGSGAPIDSLKTAAVENNIAWCDVMCRVHGCHTVSGKDLWIAEGPRPPYYPAAISRGTDASRTLRSIEAFFARHPSDTMGLKDSYAELDVANLGCCLLFEARWIGAVDDSSAVLNPQYGSQPEPHGRPGYSWRVIEDSDDLASWERDWNGGNESEDRIFLPSLLEDGRVKIIAAGERSFDAGFIVSLGGGAAGISNCFSKTGIDRGFWLGVAATVRKLFPGYPMVGYEGGESLDTALAAGFSDLGPLRVWLREGEKPEP